MRPLLKLCLSVLLPIGLYVCCNFATARTIDADELASKVRPLEFTKKGFSYRKFDHSVRRHGNQPYFFGNYVLIARQSDQCTVEFYRKQEGSFVKREWPIDILVCRPSSVLFYLSIPDTENPGSPYAYRELEFLSLDNEGFLTGWCYDSETSSCCIEDAKGQHPSDPRKIVWNGWYCTQAVLDRIK